MCWRAQPPQVPKYWQTGAIRSGLGSRMASASARGSPGSAATFTSSPGSVKGTNSVPSGPCARPSACAPRRSILTSSSMAGADQHFLVAAAASNRRGHLGEHLPAWGRIDERPAPPPRLAPCACASRTMPPLPTASRPASNCGFTKATSQAPGAARLERRRQRLGQAG